jgi:hypothetical protein
LYIAIKVHFGYDVPLLVDYMHMKNQFSTHKERSVSMALDLSAAFDTLDTDLLVKKLEVLGVAGNMTTWVRSYLTGRRQRVDWDGCSSEMIDITVGSPQGSVLSPLLFLIMTCDLEEWLSEGSAVTFADDTTCYAMAPTHEEVRRILVRSAEEI